MGDWAAGGRPLTREQDASPLGTIYLEDILVVDRSSEKPSQKFVFALRGEDYSRTWFLSAASEAEMDDWMATIRTAMTSGQQSAYKVAAAGPGGDSRVEGGGRAG